MKKALLSKPSNKRFEPWRSVLLVVTVVSLILLLAFRDDSNGLSEDAVGEGVLFRNLPNYMSMMRPDTTVYQMLILGTHHSESYKYNLATLAKSKISNIERIRCQGPEVTLEWQVSHGVRYFDYRLGGYDTAATRCGLPCGHAHFWSGVCVENEFASLVRYAGSSLVKEVFIVKMKQEGSQAGGLIGGPTLTLQNRIALRTMIMTHFDAIAWRSQQVRLGDFWESGRSIMLLGRNDWYDSTRFACIKFGSFDTQCRDIAPDDSGWHKLAHIVRFVPCPGKSTDPNKLCFEADLEFKGGGLVCAALIQCSSPHTQTDCITSHISAGLQSNRLKKAGHVYNDKSQCEAKLTKRKSGVCYHPQELKSVVFGQSLADSANEVYQTIVSNIDNIAYREVKVDNGYRRDDGKWDQPKMQRVNGVFLRTALTDELGAIKKGGIKVVDELHMANRKTTEWIEHGIRLAQEGVNPILNIIPVDHVENEDKNFLVRQIFLKNERVFLNRATVQSDQATATQASF